MESLVDVRSSLSDKKLQELSEKYLVKERGSSKYKKITFELVGNKYGWHKHIKSTTLMMIDKYQYRLRNVSNFDSPFIDDQDGVVNIKSLHFVNGILVVDPNVDICSLYYLLLNPDNVDNGGSLYSISNPVEKAKVSYSLSEKRFMAFDYINGLSSEQLKKIYMYVENAPYKAIEGVEELILRNKLAQRVLSGDITDLNEILDTKGNKRVDNLWYLEMALSLDLIRILDNTIKYKNGREIIQIPKGKTGIEALTDWCDLTDDGKKFLESLKQKISK